MEKKETKLKILFTSVGRRVELIQAFRAAADRLGTDLCIYGTDVSDSAPALQFCDRREPICQIEDERYIPQLLSICRRERINAVIPTIDTDLPALAQSKEDFLRYGTRVIVSEPDMVAQCRDKRLSAKIFLHCGLQTPDTVENIGDYSGGYPAFIKPADGSSSIDTFRVESFKELEVRSKLVPNHIVQPFISGTEYTVDAFCDFAGEPLLITPRIRVSVRAGEVIRTRITQDERVISEVKALLAVLKPCGQIAIQLIRDPVTDEDFFIEINPRFGGGAPLSIRAGADSAEMLLRILLGEKLAYREKAAEDGVEYSRFDQSVRVN